MRSLFLLLTILSTSSPFILHKAFTPTSVSLSATSPFLSSNPSLVPIFDELSQTVSKSSPSDSTPVVILPDCYEESGKPSSNSEPLNAFLIYLQSTLQAIDIGKQESKFISAGRDIMAITRFQEFPSLSVSSGVLALCCWTEIAALMKDGKDDTGCLVVLPNLDLEGGGIDSWVNSNVVGPLDDLGLSSSWSIITYDPLDNSPYPAIRLLYKVSNAPKDNETDMTDEELDKKVDAMYERAERQVKAKKEAKRKKQEKKEKKKATIKDRPGGAGFRGGKK